MAKYGNRYNATIHTVLYLKLSNINDTLKLAIFMIVCLANKLVIAH